MFKTVCLQVVLLLGFVGCGSEKRGVETTDSLYRSKPKPNNQTSVSRQNEPDSLFYCKISYEDANALYTFHASKVKLKERPKHYCKAQADKKRTLQYLRLIRSHITDHIPALDTNKLRDFSSLHTGIRLYPYLEIQTDGKLNDRYILVYTLPVDPQKRDGYQRDDMNTFRIVELKLSADKWCNLGHSFYMTKAQVKLSEHKLCNPDCPDVPSLTF